MSSDMAFPDDRALDSTDIYAVPVCGAFLLWSPCRGVSALINRKALEYVKELPSGKGKAPRGSGNLQELWDSLQRPPKFPPDKKGPVTPPFFGIIPTRRCNLSCVYCGFGAGKADYAQMDLRMAARAVDWIAETAYQRRKETFEIHFFGGEPFVGMEVIEVAVHRARTLYEKMAILPRFEVATNGYFNDDVAHFVGHYFDAVILSFDGPKEIHDRNRPVNPRRGSFGRVAQTASLLSRSPAELCFRMCVTQESVHQMERISRWFADAFQPAIVNFETLQPTPESAHAGLRPPNPYDFAECYIRSSRNLREQGIAAVYASAALGETRHSFCPVGKDTVILSPDGRVSSCHLLKETWETRDLDMDIGRFGDDGAMQFNMENIKRLRAMVRDKPQCARCFCRWTCAGGCHVNHSFPGSPLDYADFCIQTRIVTACSLLEEMGMRHQVERLLEDRAAMEVLALAPSDRVGDVGNGLG
jgi:uncharacterized protein